MSTTESKKSAQSKFVGKNACNFNLFGISYALLWGVSSAGLERLPVTQKVEGSSPLHPARDFTADKTAVFQESLAPSSNG